MVKQDDLVALVISAAMARQEKIPPVEFIAKAIERVNLSEEEVNRYPLDGTPSLKGIADIANRLWKESETGE